MNYQVELVSSLWILSAASLEGLGPLDNDRRTMSCAGPSQRSSVRSWSHAGAMGQSSCDYRAPIVSLLANENCGGRPRWLPVLEILDN